MANSYNASKVPPQGGMAKGEIKKTRKARAKLPSTMPTLTSFINKMPPYNTTFHEKNARSWVSSIHVVATFPNNASWYKEKAERGRSSGEIRYASKLPKR